MPLSHVGAKNNELANAFKKANKMPSGGILISMNFRISNFACSQVDPIASLVSKQFLFSL